MKEILNSFEKIDRKDYDEFQISSALNKLEIKDGDEILKAEIMAFDFAEFHSNTPSHWGTFFGPKFQLPNEQGQMVEYPSIKLVTDKMIEYWKQRSSIVQNPIMRARYRGLVYEFERIVTGNLTDHKIVVEYVNDLLEIVREDYSKNRNNLFLKIKRALTIALKLNSQDLIESIKSTILNLKIDPKYRNDGKWEFAFDNLLNNKKINLKKNEIAEIINGLEDKLERVTSGGEHKVDPWLAEHTGVRLANYYRKLHTDDEVRRVLIAVKSSYEAILDQSSGMQAVNWFENLHKIFASFQLYKEAEDLLILIRKHGERAAAEMGKVPFNFEISKIELEKYVDEMLNGSEAEILIKIAQQYIPYKEQAKESIKEISKIAPTQFIIGQRIIDGKGRTIATIGSLENDLDGHIILNISQTMLLSSVFLHPVLETGISRKKITAESFIKYLTTSPLISADRIPIFEKAFRSYLEGDYLTSIHLFVPQMEEAIRTLLELLGGTVLKPSKNGSGYSLRTLDELLRDPILSGLLGEDLPNYLRILLTDQRGWNLRNNVCHGMANNSTFNQTNADRLVHALLCIGLVNK